MIMKTKFCFLGLGIFITSLFVAQQSPSTSIRSERLQTFFERIKKNKTPISTQRYSSNKTNKIQEDNAILYLPTRSVRYNWNIGNNNWDYSDSSTYLYYTSTPNLGKLLDETIYRDSLPSSKYYYQYNNYGLLQCKKNFNYQSWSGQWAVSGRDTLYYNNSNKLVKWENQYYSSYDQYFRTTEKGVNTYNNYQKIIKQTIYDTYNNYYYGDTTLYPYSQVLVNYNLSQQYTDMTYQEYDTSAKMFVNNLRELYNYDNTGKINKITLLNWNQSTNKWDTASISLITWYKWISNNVEDLCNNLPSVIIIKQRYSPGVYLNSEKYEFTYDPIDDEQIEEKDYYWDGSLGGWYWDWGWKEILTRNPYYGNMIVEKIIQYKQTYNQNYTNYSKTVYKQPSFTNLALISKNSDVVIYPNPANDFFNIIINSNTNNKIALSIYDIIGKKIKTINIDDVNKPNKIEIGNLEKAIYFIELTNRENNAVIFRSILVRE